MLSRRPALYTCRMDGWSSCASTSASRRNQARSGVSGRRCTRSPTCRLSTRSRTRNSTRSPESSTTRSSSNRSPNSLAKSIGMGGEDNGAGRRPVVGRAIPRPHTVRLCGCAAARLSGEVSGAWEVLQPARHLPCPYVVDIPRPKQKKHGRLVAIGAGVVVLVVVTVALSKLKPAAPTVQSSQVWPDTVKRGPMLREVRGPGTLVPEQIRYISAVTGGRVENVPVRPGAQVQPGTVLMTFSNPD